MKTFIYKTSKYKFDIKRIKPSLLQVNVGYKCNLNCDHCHFGAGPKRKESMNWSVMLDILEFIKKFNIKEIDITGGAPELNPHITKFISKLREQGIVKSIILRTNLCILDQEQFKNLPEFFYNENVDLVASLPCYLEENVNKQRGNNIFQANIRVIKRLNCLGYGKEGSCHKLNLVYNPSGNFLPVPQFELESAYKEYLQSNYGVTFNKLFTITNMPIGRFRDRIVKEGEFENYMKLSR